MYRMKKKKTAGWRLIWLTCLLALALTLPAAAAAPVITRDLNAAATAVSGQSITLSIEAQGESLTYQWYSTQGLLAGEEKSSLTMVPDEKADGMGFFCRVSNDDGSVDSTTCYLSVKTGPAITQDIPGSLTVRQGELIQLTCAASGEQLSYQWYTTTGVLTGSTGPTLSLTAQAEYNGLGFYCQATNPYGAASTTVCWVTVTAAATPTPTPSPTPNPSSSPTPTPSPTAVPAPVITKNPTGETVTAGGRALFIARADNTETYTWRFVSGDGTRSYTYANITGAFPTLGIAGGDTDTLTLTNIPFDLNGWKVICRFTGPGGETDSAAALITVRQAELKEPTITRQPTGGEMDLEENLSFTLTVMAAVTDGGSLTYQWYCTSQNDISTISAIQGAERSSYTPARTEGTMYYCVAVTSVKDGEESSPVYSDLVAVTFTKEEHVHDFGMEWKYNDLSHWHECECGLHQDEDYHSFVWTVVKEPTAREDGLQDGVCSVCGYRTTQTIPAGSQTGTDQESSGGRGWLIAGFVFLALAVIGAGALLIVRVLRGQELFSFRFGRKRGRR